jgi:hypothetical protein
MEFQFYQILVLLLSTSAFTFHPVRRGEKTSRNAKEELNMINEKIALMLPCRALIQKGSSWHSFISNFKRKERKES